MSQTEALFDIRVIDTDALSYGNQSLLDVLIPQLRTKSDSSTTLPVRSEGHCLSLCIFVDGMMGNEAFHFQNIALFQNTRTTDNDA